MSRSRSTHLDCSGRPNACKHGQQLHVAVHVTTWQKAGTVPQGLVTGRCCISEQDIRRKFCLLGEQLPCFFRANPHGDYVYPCKSSSVKYEGNESGCKPERPENAIDVTASYWHVLVWWANSSLEHPVS